MPSRAHRRTTGIHLSELLTPTMRALALEVLRNRTYRRLFSAQIVALVGTGTLAYVGIAPVISALTAHVPRNPAVRKCLARDRHPLAAVRHRSLAGILGALLGLAAPTAVVLASTRRLAGISALRALTTQTLPLALVEPTMAT